MNYSYKDEEFVFFCQLAVYPYYRLFHSNSTLKSRWLRKNLISKVKNRGGERNTQSRGLRQSHEEESENPVQHKKNAEDNYSLIEELTKTGDASPLYRHHQKSQMIPKLKKDINEGQQS